MADHVMTVIPNLTLREGLLGVKSRQVSLIITEQTVIFARMTSQRMKAITTTTPGNAFEVLGATYQKMTPTEILAEHTDNFAVARDQIAKVKVKVGGAYDGGAGNDLLIVVTRDKKYKLTLLGSAKAAKAALARAGL